MSKSKVSIVKCESYASSEVEAAVSKSLELIGGMKSFVKPGSKVLLKVNTLTGVGPEKAVTTHPQIVVAVAKEVIKAGAKPIIGDCYGDRNARFEEIFEKTGIKAAADSIGVEVVNLAGKGIVEVNVKGSVISPLHVSRIVREADAVINLPKLKTHELTLITCAIKNMFGIIPGFSKSKYHALTPKPHDFANTLVEVFRAKIPVLNIVDAVIGMEGSGPQNGIPRKMGLIIASADAVAIDSLCAKMMGLDPQDVDTTKIAHEKGLGESDISRIEVLGVEPEPFKDFKRTYSSYIKMNRLPGFLFKISGLITNLIKVKPVINKKKCVKCMVCVNNCPAKVIDGKSFKIDHKNCIMCFCCRELCRYDAVDLKRNILLEMARKLKG